jgi:hypothetical protein
VLAVVAYGALATVHNLTVARQHTYYVSADERDVLTHNIGPNNCPVHGPDWVPTLPDGRPIGLRCNGRSAQCPRSPGTSQSTTNAEATAEAVAQREQTETTRSGVASSIQQALDIAATPTSITPDSMGSFAIIAAAAAAGAKVVGSKVKNRIRQWGRNHIT